MEGLSRLPFLAGLLALDHSATACGDCRCHGPGDTNGSSFVIVRPSTVGQNGVTEFHSTGSTGSVTFVVGPAIPPYGDGSVELSTGADGNSGEELRFATLNGHLLSDVTALSYWTYV